MGARSERRRRQGPPVHFESVRRWMDQINIDAGAIGRLLGSYHYGPIYDLHAAGLSEAEKVEAARAIMDKALARYVTLLVGHVSQLNRLLEDKPPLSETDEIWLRRQLEGLDGGRA
jgi:hypothetical protein